MTKTTAYNVGVGMTVAMGSFTYGFGISRLPLLRGMMLTERHRFCSLRNFNWTAGLL